MGDISHLRPIDYAVDSHGETTTVPAPPPPSGPTNGEPVPKRGLSKARPRYAVPTDRLRFDMQVKALLVVAASSRNGTESVDAEKMGTAMRIAPITAVLNNAFFVSVGLIEKVSKGDYKPTELALEFQRRWTFEKDAAGKLLAPAFIDSWFMNAVREQLQVNETTTVPQMVAALAGVANTDSSYSTQYRNLLEWLEYAGLISMDGGVVTLTHGADGDDGDAGPPSPPPAESKGEGATAGHAGKPSDPLPAPVRGPYIVSLTFDVTLTADDLAKLAPEQITSLFDGLGKVAAIKAALSQ